MKKTCCSIACTPIRLEPSDRSEMVSQLLFGEMFEIIEVSNAWTKIRTEHDGYEGWADTRVISEREISAENMGFTHQLWSSVTIGDRSLILPYGSVLNAEEDEFLIHDFCFGEISEVGKIIEDLEKFLHTPYLWGGRSSFGIDCSGLVQITARVNGYHLPRDAYQQAAVGDFVDYGKHKAGDLAFFHNQEDKIIHVGVLTAEDEIIHASGWVRKDRFDERGIFDEKSGNYSHKFALIRRVYA